MRRLEVRSSVLGAPGAAGSSGAGGTVLAEFASSSRHLDLDGLMEAVLAEAIESGWIEDAFLAQKRIAADRDGGGTRKHP